MPELICCSRPDRWAMFTFVTAEGVQIQISDNTYLYSGEEIWAASPSSVDVQAAIDLASDGDTVRVPGGSETWTSNVTVPSTKGVKVIGAGVGLTNIDLGGLYGIFLDTRPTNSRVRLSGFSFANPPINALHINDYTIGATDWRVDHIQWSNGSAANCIRVTGYTFGVFDHCTWWNCFRPLWMDAHLGTEGAPGNPQGSHSWTQPLDQGGPSAVYFEDCEVHNDVADIFINCRGGARYVWRYNHMTGAAQQFQTHSGCTPGYRNPRWSECYENSWEETSGSNNPAYWLRSMNGLVFNNVTGSAHPAFLRIDFEFVCSRLEPCTAPWPIPGYLQDPPIEETYWVYPAQDQPGVGLDTGWDTSQSVDEAKILAWSNTRLGVDQPIWFEGCTLAYSLVQENRDYYNRNANFLSDPTSGIGVGTLAQRPSSGMVAGVYYWATDERVLYKAISPIVWVAWYVPYTYPHPVTLL